ncbi:hypothetical protein DPMN_073838 [Dreissena polymorpha]|uniref:Uncharacterized protein n=1 Tax=Dreissena polymorpha TaxID=45954 RepID=A0A9D4BZR0_DREPO|nr:hypothetical protein DPMN_073838 [Dreissena polymorpha]
MCEFLMHNPHNPLQSTNLLLHRLHAGDKVLVKTTYVGYAEYGFYWSAFSAFLLYAHGKTAIVG